jgi:hypothetical protein
MSTVYTLLHGSSWREPLELQNLFLSASEAIKKYGGTYLYMYFSIGLLIAALLLVGCSKI